MDFALNSEQRLFQERFRAFADEVVRPRAAEIDRSGEFPRDVIDAAAELGLLGLPIPEEYGGIGADNISFVLLIEELSAACGSTGLTVAAHTGLVCVPLLLFGNEEQKHRWLEPLARGEMLGAFGLTEPQAGSDAGATRTTAVRDGDEFVINGQKIFTTNGSIAGVIIVTAVTDPSAGNHGISNIIVPADTPGLSFGQNQEKMGLHGSVTSQVYFQDCRVPVENLLGKPGEGFKQFLQVLDGGRVGIGAMSVGMGRAALDAARSYAQEREQFGHPIADFQAISFMLADMATNLEAAQWLVLQAAWLRDCGQRYTKQAAMAKLFASEAAERICHKAIQIHGGYGYTNEYPVERYYRDVRLTEIGEGTSEIQRLVISRQLLRDAGM
ncbi:MAG TPA: acyl-CoA dehydrogenase [Thermomicrobiaceae bacterium]|nr:acyl-CoA dehydrogenase [Thermomicrobiaceae bacterium]